MTTPARVDLLRLTAGVAAVVAVTAIYTSWLGVSNPTIVAMTFLTVVLLVAATARLRVALAVSVVAMLSFNFFFLPPVGTFTIADPQNWVALFAFLAVSVVASNLSAVARARTAEGIGSRDELERLFDLTIGTSSKPARPGSRSIGASWQQRWRRRRRCSNSTRRRGPMPATA